MAGLLFCNANADILHRLEMACLFFPRVAHNGTTENFRNTRGLFGAWLFLEKAA